MTILSPVERAVIVACVHAAGDLGFRPISVSLCDRDIEGDPDETRAASCALSVVEGMETLLGIFDFCEISLNLRGQNPRRIGEGRDAWMVFIAGNGRDVLHDWNGRDGFGSDPSTNAIIQATNAVAERFGED